MKASDMRSQTDDQLEKQLSDLHAEWRDLRFQEAVGQLTATARIKQIRKDIARVHTIRTERLMEALAKDLLGEQAS